MDESVQRLETYRKATLAACLNVTICPEALEIFKEAATVERSIQELALNYWNGRKLAWSAIADSHSRFPNFPFKLIEPEQVVITLSYPYSLQLHPSNITLSLKSENLASSANLSRSHLHEWKVSWVE